MGLNTIFASGAIWFWDQYGKTLVDKAFDKSRQGFSRFRWQDAETKYRSRMLELYSTTRLLGYPKPIVIEEIFTDVYLMNKVSALRKFNIEQLEEQKLYENIDWPGLRVLPGLDVVLSEKRLYILGKPGSGKTTFLKYLTLQACKGKIPYTPIFVSLKEWADSGLDLLPYLVQLFDICSFPDAEAFITTLLLHGAALVLFDGLDEVNQEGDQRRNMINVLTQFARQYPASRICVTCRVAASDYSFDQFNYLEMADFNSQQKHVFIRKWYQDDEKKFQNFIQGFEREDNRNLRELARTPLLLALLCLAYDETLDFPL